MKFRDRQIRQKLTIMLFGISGLVLVLTSGAFVLYAVLSFRNTASKNLSAIGSVLAANSAGSLAFANEADARDVLSALKAQPHIIAAALYNRDGRLFAKYPSDVLSDSLPAVPGAAGYRFDRARLVGFEPVHQGTNAKLGTLYLASDLKALGETLRLSALIALLGFTLSLIVAYVLSRSLQKAISQPILSLAETARAISDRKDYSVRAPELGGGEMGQLTRAFNQMLSQIEEQNRVVRESKERLDLALSSAGVGTWDRDLMTGAVFLDDFLHELFGTKPTTFGGTDADFEKLLHPDDRERARLDVECSIAGKTSYDTEYRILRADGSERVLAARGRVFRDTVGTPVRLAGTSWDVTERKKVEDQRQEMAAIIESADDAIISNALDGTIRSWNPGAERLFGYRAEEVIGRPLRQLISEDRWGEELKIVERLKQGEHLRHIESVWRTNTGASVPVSLTSSLVKDRHGRVVAGSQILRDITEQKLAERRLELAVTELERSNKELEQFAYVASHDLQEPLRMVVSYTELLERRYSDRLDDDAREFIRYAVDGASRMQGLINALLHFSRVSTSSKPPEAVDLGEVLGEVRFALTAAIAESGALLTNDALPTIRAHRMQMGQLLQNLIGNALKFRGKESPHVNVTAADLDTEWRISVSDNGIGIAPSYFDRIFVIFQRLHTKQEYEGTGIGLAICRRIVERAGGRIWVESEPGKGTTFHFTVPKQLESARD